MSDQAAEIIEQVAKAICVTYRSEWWWENGDREPFRVVARAAIETYEKIKGDEEPEVPDHVRFLNSLRPYRQKRRS